LTSRRKESKIRWILASASPRREEILSRLGMRLHVVPSGIPEPARKPREGPAGYAVRAARLKAEEVAGRYRSGIILGADTIVVLGDDILGKPSTRAEAQAMLKRLSGRWHEVISGMCLFRCNPRRICSAFGRSRVHFRRLSSAEIDWYLRTGEYRDKAGAYGAQGYASLFIDRIEGCYFNVVGFPVTVFERLCRKMGIDLTEELVRNSRFQIRD
jgi:septum formation protein